MSVDPKLARGHKIAEKDFVFTNELWMVYSLGIGFNRDPLNEEEFKFTYEMDDDFTTFPTISVLALKTFVLEMFDTPGFPQFNIMMLLHGEQIVESYKPIAPNSTVRCTSIMEDVADKGKGMLMTIKCSITDIETGELYSISYMKFFVRGLGGFGDKGTLVHEFPAIPEREADHIVECPTEKNQAFIYRLAGDFNPLHVSPNMSTIGGFDVPILHGLWTYGIVARAVYTQYCGGDTTLIKSVCSRFTSHVYPGETIIVSMYKDGNKVLFSAKTKERELEISFGYVELKPEAKL